MLKPTGSFVLNINDCVIKGERSLYVFDLVAAIRRVVGLLYIERYLWVKTASFPGRFKYRFKDQIEYLFHFAPTHQLKLRPDAVRVPVKPESIKRTLRERRRNIGRLWSGSGSGLSRDQAKMPVDLALPGNVITTHPENKIPWHSAPGPLALPRFFIRAMTDPGDLVVDPFLGSGTTGVAAIQEGRRFMGWEIDSAYALRAQQRIEHAAHEAARLRQGRGRCALSTNRDLEASQPYAQYRD